MPIDTTPSVVATNALQAIPFSTLIGCPLDAAIKAQAMAAQTSWEFIQQVGLNPVPNSDQMEARNVTFFYNKNGQMTKFCHRYNWISRGRDHPIGYGIDAEFARHHEYGNDAT